MLSESFWQDTRIAKQKQKELSSTKKIVEVCRSIKNVLSDVEAGLEILQTCEDRELENELDSRLYDLNNRLKNLEVARMFSGPYDSNGAILTIQSGAGGTEKPGRCPGYPA